MDIDDFCMAIVWVIFIFAAVFAGGIILMVLSSLFVRVNFGEKNISGIVYNLENNSFWGGNTYFSIRAGENTLITSENQSSFCLPPEAVDDIKIINEAGADKRIKVNIQTEKGIWFLPPWKCLDKMTVTKVE
jgi:hypothetical protein